jgi:hypothetical protein
MTLGLRQVLLLAATIVFIVSIFINNGADWTNWISIGFVLLAGAFLVGEMGWDRPLNAAGPRRPHE